MPAKRIDLTGRKIGKLTVLEYSHFSKGSYWKCICECGGETTVRSTHLLSGAVKTCGCSWVEQCKKMQPFAVKANITHGDSITKRSRLYIIWTNMLQRCENNNCISYENYGERGITVISEWHDYTEFKDWALQNGYAENLSIDRIDNDKGYFPENCRWVARLVQANNTRKNVNITFKGETKTLAQWAKEYNIPITTFDRWLKKGELFEDIINKKCGKYRGKQHLCEICGNSFISHSHKSIYCSDNCKRVGENSKQQQRRIQKKVV